MVFHSLRRLLFLAGVLSVAQAAHGALVVNDTFDYGPADLADGYGSWSDGTNNARYESGTTATWGGDSDYTLIPVGKSAGGSFASNNAASLPAARGVQLDLGLPSPAPSGSA